MTKNSAELAKKPGRKPIKTPKPIILSYSELEYDIKRKLQNYILDIFDTLGVFTPLSLESIVEAFSKNHYSEFDTIQNITELISDCLEAGGLDEQLEQTNDGKYKPVYLFVLPTNKFSIKISGKGFEERFYMLNKEIWDFIQDKCDGDFENYVNGMGWSALCDTDYEIPEEFQLDEDDCIYYNWGIDNDDDDREIEILDEEGNDLNSYWVLNYSLSEELRLFMYREPKGWETKHEYINKLNDKFKDIKYAARSLLDDNIVYKTTIEVKNHTLDLRKLILIKEMAYLPIKLNKFTDSSYTLISQDGSYDGEKFVFDTTGYGGDGGNSEFNLWKIDDDN